MPYQANFRTITLPSGETQVSSPVPRRVAFLIGNVYTQGHTAKLSYNNQSVLSVDVNPGFIIPFYECNLLDAIDGNWSVVRGSGDVGFSWLEILDDVDCGPHEYTVPCGCPYGLRTTQIAGPYGGQAKQVFPANPNRIALIINGGGSTANIIISNVSFTGFRPQYATLFDTAGTFTMLYRKLGDVVRGELWATDDVGFLVRFTEIFTG